MAYDPRPVEPAIYKRWLDAGVFQPRDGGEPYVIVIPPPNVTDVLHVGHEAFVRCVWEFVRKTGNTILEQLKVIGSSCDWSRLRFTLDEKYSAAVREVFVR